MKKYLLVAAMLFCPSVYAGITTDSPKLNIVNQQSLIGTSSVQSTEKFKFSLRYTAKYDARQMIALHGITDKTKTVFIYLTIGAVVYTIDGKMPVLTDGVLHLSIHDVLKLTREQALKFKALAGMNYTEFNVLILDNYVK